MKLVLKFNLALVLAFLVGFGAAAAVSHQLLFDNAREEILQNARMIMASAISARTYTSKQVAPLLKKLPPDEFIPQTVPAFAATEQFNTLRADFPDFNYKEATLNPTNLRDKATDWEVDVVNKFKQTADLPELVLERQAATGPSLVMARPIRIKDEACLICHSTVDVAPRAMIQKYGEANGFGWQLGDVIGAQIVSVPMSLPIRRAERAFATFLTSLAGVFLVVFALLNVMLMVIVVRRVTRLARLADEVSLGKLDGPDFGVGGRDEVSGLGQSFNRMKRSLVQAMKMLEDG